MFPKIVMKHICFNANDGKDLMPPWIISLANKLPTIEWEWVYPKKTVGVSRQFSYVSSFATIFNLPGPEKHELKTLSKLKCFGYLIYGITTLGVLPLRASLPPPQSNLNSLRSFLISSPVSPDRWTKEPQWTYGVWHRSIPSLREVLEDFTTSVVDHNSSSPKNELRKHTVDGSEIRRSPVEVGSWNPIIYEFYTSQVVSDFFHPQFVPHTPPTYPISARGVFFSSSSKYRITTPKV